eukprot:1140448-Pelagomonas_calceolata.AAC.2
MTNKKLEQASTALSLTARKLVEPNGAGITNTICRAELAAIVAAITHHALITHCFRQSHLSSSNT